MPRKSTKNIKEKTKAKKPVAKIEEIAPKPAKVEVAKTAKKEKAPKAVPAEKKLPRKKTVKHDTGSVDFQIANFTEKITTLAKHLKKHAHDFDSRRGLLIMVGKRRRLLNYVKKTDLEKYEKLAQSLKVKK